MALKQEVVVEIAPDGTVKLETFGLKGSECSDELKPIEKALGGKSEVKPKPEFYEKSVKTKNEQTVGGGKKRP